MAPSLLSSSPPPPSFSRLAEVEVPGSWKHQGDLPSVGKEPVEASEGVGGGSRLTLGETRGQWKVGQACGGFVGPQIPGPPLPGSPSCFLRAG